MRIQYICFTAHSGFAFAAKNNIKALISGGYNISVTPLDLGFNKIVNPSSFRELRKLVDSTPGDIQIYHCIPIMQRRVPCAGRVIGYGTFEHSQYPQEWINILEKNDTVLVPSQFNFNSLLLNNKFYLPHCLDFSEYSYFNKRSSHYRFLYFGTWKNRKNYDILLRAFTEEFTKESVELVLKVTQNQLNTPVKSISRIYRQLGKTANISVDSHILTDEEISKYLQKFNCMVLPTLGEGFCIPGLQAMASGLPLIITNYSGCTEYANSETSLLLEIEGFEKKKDIDGILQFRDREWPIISVDQLRRKMRYAYENRSSMNSLAESAYEFVINRFNYSAILKRFEKILK